ncbi:MotA/TolQ/ExbB proton channel family protein [Cysteiniphilum sp. 6C5]|uniref:MotA/TolQ/ExbB proton channel family protein n=1 Tax=unclassified Cysteiniphilum TaxID=2610889 RepID=UPI003F83AAC0
MTKIKNFSALIIVMGALMIAFAVVDIKALIVVISHNTVINTLIVTGCFLAVLYAMYSAIQLRKQANLWQRELASDTPFADEKALKSIFGSRFYHLVASNGGALEALIEEWREYKSWSIKALEYMSATLIGLGLLGTFIGMMRTMSKVSDVLNMSSASNILNSLTAPLAGMSTAFSASLLGLLFSLIVGLFAIILARATTDFTQQIKAWMLDNNMSDSESGNHSSLISKGAKPTFKLLNETLPQIAVLLQKNNEMIATLHSSQESMQQQHNHVIASIDQKLDIYLQQCVSALAAVDEKMLQITNDLPVVSQNLMEIITHSASTTDLLVQESHHRVEEMSVLVSDLMSTFRKFQAVIVDDVERIEKATTTQSSNISLNLLQQMSQIKFSLEKMLNEQSQL